MLRLCRLLITLVLVCAALLPRPAAAADPAPGEFTGKSKNAVLMDATSGAVLYQKNADELVAPASTSKLMTLAVLFKAMKSGQLKREDEFLMSVNAWRTGGALSEVGAGVRRERWNSQSTITTLTRFQAMPLMNAAE